MKKTISIISSFILLGLWVCPIAASAKEKKAYTVQVVVDRGMEGKSKDEQDQLNQVGDCFNAYIVEVFADNDVTATLIPSRDKFEAAAGRYLLSVKFVHYNPGSKAARMLVGMGAGATSLDLHYELFGVEKDPLLTKDHGRGSSRDWRNVCKALAKDLYKAVDEVATPKAAAAKGAGKEPAK